jgi:hypothetical protein
LGSSRIAASRSARPRVAMAELVTNRFSTGIPISADARSMSSLALIPIVRDSKPLTAARNQWKPLTIS